MAEIMNQSGFEYTRSVDNSRKSILARGCDPLASLEASRAIPPQIGNPEYVPATDDKTFFELLRSRDWSVVFFAPGACRFGAANHPIPGAMSQSEGWTLEQYRGFVHKHQTGQVQIVETVYESETVSLLREALDVAPEVHGNTRPVT